MSDLQSDALANLATAPSSEKVGNAGRAVKGNDGMPIKRAFCPESMRDPRITQLHSFRQPALSPQTQSPATDQPSFSRKQILIDASHTERREPESRRTGTPVDILKEGILC